MARHDGGNYEAQTPYPMPQSQQRRMVQTADRLTERRLRQEAETTRPRQNYPPQTQNERYPGQPMLGSDAMAERMEQYRRMMQGEGYVDPVSASNDQNFATIGLPFIYTLDQATNGFIELASGATGNFTINVSSDADFILQAITARATREFVFLMVDSGSDRRLSTQPASAIASFGGVGRAFAPTTPQLFSAATQILIQITDGGDRSPNIYNGGQVADADLEPQVGAPQNLVNKIGLMLHGVKRLRPPAAS